MKTAEDFINDNEPVKLRELRDTMVEFAQYHVEQALKQASIKVSTRDIQGSILNAYPLENIKPCSD